MSVRFENLATGTAAALLEKLHIPASLAGSAGSESHSLWAIPSPDDTQYALVPAAANPTAPALAHANPAAWLPGATLFARRQTHLRASARAEYSALFTSLASPVKTALTGDIGLDFDLGIQASASWQSETNCWFSLHRPAAAPTPQLRLRLASAANRTRRISVQAAAAAGLDNATRNALAAAAGQHRNQILARLRRGLFDGLDRLAVIARATGLDPASPQAAPAFQELLAAPTQALWDAIDTFVPYLDAQAARLTDTLDQATRAHLERSLQADLSFALSSESRGEALLDATFDFSVSNPRLQAVLDAALQGILDPLLSAPVPGITLHKGILSDTLNTRRTFEWRLPWSSGKRVLAQQVQSAIESLDLESGRLSRGSASAISARQARRAVSVLQLDAALAAFVSPHVTVHTPAAASVRFHLDMRTSRPASLRPLLALYGQTEIPESATRLRLTAVVPPAGIAPWLEDSNPLDASRRLQRAWRALLPALVDMDDHNLPTAAPLLVWASMPVAAGACVDGSTLRLNTGKEVYWDWRDESLRGAMINNQRTRDALAARIALTHLDATPAQAVAACRDRHAKALLESLLFVESGLVGSLPLMFDRLRSLRQMQNAALSDYMRCASNLLHDLTLAFHVRLTSIYGPDIARAAGPLMLAAATDSRPSVEVLWS